MEYVTGCHDSHDRTVMSNRLLNTSTFKKIGLLYKINKKNF